MSGTPIIVIVGRPNVGKSTLFNRMTAKRSALVSDVPGLTRDRREGSMVLGRQPITLVDTAGLEGAVKGPIAGRMCRQTEAAIGASDLVLFLIDAREGITAADQEVARVVRNSGRPVILVANKCEGRKGADGYYEAFELGVGEPVAISAEHGEGLGELQRDVLAALGVDGQDGGSAQARENGEKPGERPIRVAIVGRPNSGKSTLVNALLGEERMITGPEPGLTRDAIAIDFVWEGSRLRLFDTAGLRRRAKITELAEKLSVGDALRAIRFAEAVVLLIDAEHPFEHQDLSIGDLVAQEGRALVIAVNKWDLIEEKQKRLQDLREMVAASLAQLPGVALVPISALGESGFDKLMRAVREAYEVWNRRIPTPELNRWLREAMARHAPPTSKGRRIKIRYLTQPSTRPPLFIAFCSQPDGLPKAYLRYLTNGLRKAFGLPGVPIRWQLRKGQNPFAKG